jgi:hypothetical protein
VGFEPTGVMGGEAGDEPKETLFDGADEGYPTCRIGTCGDENGDDSGGELIVYDVFDGDWSDGIGDESGRGNEGEDMYAWSVLMVKFVRKEDGVTKSPRFSLDLDKCGVFGGSFDSNVAVESCRSCPHVPWYTVDCIVI